MATFDFSADHSNDTDHSDYTNDRKVHLRGPGANFVLADHTNHTYNANNAKHTHYANEYVARRLMHKLLVFLFSADDANK